ncbi:MULTISPECIES: hypothetical protein [unclassified Streptomyces]|uniref:hypothetical protein n=1 Tax=unclassified Streptomyces TaxID=2593676 RepID=UPI000364C4A0|nr:MULTISPECIES: hypothetical protein [unclassified Streptomyces]MYX36720.1 hypothetical protein [Streptomyces sp. SID8377]
MAFNLAPAGGRIQAGKTNQLYMIGALVFSALRSASQSIPTGTEAVANALQWDTVQLDALAAWNSQQPTRWTAPFAGWWTLSGSIALNGSAGGSTRDALWYINGSAPTAGRARTYAGTIVASPLTVEARTLPRLLAAGDYVELVPAHNAGAAVSTATGTYAPYMAVTYSGPA